MGCWVGSRAGLDAIEKKDLFPMPEIRHPSSSIVDTATEQTKHYYCFKRYASEDGTDLEVNLLSNI
jgi:hypothetical protein